MTMRFDRRSFLAGAGSAAALAAMGAPARAAEWKPNRPIELVIMAGTGGGADQLARLFQSMIDKERLSPMPILPVNKGGGSGAEALRYLKDKAGDPHVIMATLNSYYTTPLQQDIGVDIAEFTPIARMALDTFQLWVNADSPVKTLDDYVAAVKASNTAWKMGGTGQGQEDSLVTVMLERAFDIKMTYVPFGGGGEVAKNLVGGHVDSTVNNPSEALAFAKAGRVRAIASLTENRIGPLPDTPTMRELGQDLVYKMQRSFVAPAGIPAEAQAFYIDLFTKLHATTGWKEYAEKQALESELLTGAALQEYFLAEREKHRALLEALGA